MGILEKIIFKRAKELQTEKFNRIKKESGIYTCVDCEKETRETGDGESSCEMCKDCFAAAGLENSHSDGFHDDEKDPKCKSCNAAPRGRRE